MSKRLVSNFALLMTALIWGLSFVAQRAGMEYVGPFTFNMVRSLLGALSLVPVIIFVKVSSHDYRTPEVKHKQHINLARAGIGCGIALFIAISVQQYCMQFVDAGKAGFITALYILFVPVISILYGEKLTKNIIISVVLGIIGLFFLCFKSGCGFCKYDLLILSSAFFYAVHILVVDYYSKKAHPIKVSCVQFLIVGLLSWILVILFENISIECILSCKIPILYAGILTCGVAYTLQIFGQKYTQPVIASLILCLESVFAVLGGMLILGEVLSIKELTGCIFMISAVILSNFHPRQRF